jgi:hypothetical protein
MGVPTVPGTVMGSRDLPPHCESALVVGVTTGSVSRPPRRSPAGAGASLRLRDSDRCRRRGARASPAAAVWYTPRMWRIEERTAWREWFWRQIRWCAHFVAQPIKAVPGGSLTIAISCTFCHSGSS